MNCPVCDSIMHMSQYNYHCPKCGARINKDQLNISPNVPMNLHPRHRDTPNMAGLFWLIYTAFIVAMFLWLMWG